MKYNFAEAFEFVISWEKWKSKDWAGLTIWGITHKWHPIEVKEMSIMNEVDSKEIAKKVYKEEYWDKCNCDTLEEPLDIICFDTAVNMGVGTAKQFLKKSKDENEFLLYRIERYAKLANSKKQYRNVFLGWVNRSIDLWNQIKE